MQTSPKTLTNIQRWRLAAITFGGALAMILATTAFAAKPNMTSSTTATGTVGVSYTTSSPLYQITANNSPTSYSTTVSIPGISFDGTTGKFTGNPTTTGTYSGTITATNSSGDGKQNLTVTINPPAPVITSSPTATGTVGASFSYQITATNSPTSYATTVSIPGVSFNATGPNAGKFSGTATTAGTYSGTISATNVTGTGSQSFTVMINFPDTAPTALATISATAVYPGDIVTLDASQSHSNPDPNNPLTYQWNQLAPDPNVTLISLAPNNKAVVATFRAPPAGAPSLTVSFRVKVTDDLAPTNQKNSFSDPVSTIVYPLPTANAGSDQDVDQGTLVTLDGSHSAGVNLTYAWTAPTGITLSDPTAAKPTFTAPLFTPPDGASYNFTLVVTEHRPGLPAKDSTDQVVIRVKQPPMAYASAIDPTGNPSNVAPKGNSDESGCTTPTTVTIYGFGIDPDNDVLTPQWTQVHDTGGAPHQPDDTVVDFDKTSWTPSFTAPDVPNGQQQIDLVFQLTVYDGTINSAPSYVTIHVLNTNDPPVAGATVNGMSDDPVKVDAGTASVILDGSTSTDPNNDTLTYKWEQISGPAVALTPPSGFSSNPVATFDAPAVSVQQGSIDLAFLLTVSDGDCSNQEQVNVKVVETNHKPFADAGQPQTVPEGGTAMLDGSGSYDPDHDSLTFQWEQVHDTSGTPLQPGDPVGAFSSKTTATPDFVVPTFNGLGGSVTLQLIVTDSHGASSDPSYVVVSVYPHRPPIPHAVANPQTVDERTGVVSLTGTATDADNNPLTFTWSYVSGPAIKLNVDPSDSSKATFIAPEVPCGGAPVVMKLTVNDGYVDAFDYVTININNVNRLPTAAAGDPQNVHELETVVLNGSNSSDLDTEDTLQFQWTRTSGHTVVLSDATAAAPTFTAPEISPGGDPNAFVDLSFHLVVRDGCGGSAETDTTVHVANIPHAPTAKATGPGTANEGGDSVTLDGSGSSDPDGDSLSYAWIQTDGPAVQLNGATSATPSFTTPWVSSDTSLTFKLTVDDHFGGTSSASVTVMVLNINTPPTLVNPRADVPVLWPPDHRLVPVHILGVVDPDQPPYNATITINSITQDEPTNGLGDGDTPIDAIINGDTVLLRAERSGKGDGRVYHVCFTAADPEGSVQGCVDVIVPHDKKTDPAKDSGGKYNSTK